MKEKPILFSAPMVRAILDGSKTQTRRVLKKQPLDVVPCLDDWAGKYWVALMTRDPEPKGTLFQCRYGAPGGRLWCRETWQLLMFSTDFETGYADDWWQWDEALPQEKPEGWSVTYEATDQWDEHKDDRGFDWRPSIHMPRWASRITLEITGIRVERVQSISFDDCLAEGIVSTEFWTKCKGNTIPNIDRGNGDIDMDAGWMAYAREVYRELWDSINSTKPGRSWDANPFVWCIEFRRLP